MALSCEYTCESISCSAVRFGYETGLPPPRIHATTLSYEGRTRIPIRFSISMSKLLFTLHDVNVRASVILLPGNRWH